MTLDLAVPTAPLLAALVAGLATLVLVPLVRRYAKWQGLIDQPGPRRSHDRPVARGGGMALAVGLLAALPLLGRFDGAPTFAVALTAIALLGIADDHRPLRVRFRLPIQLAAAALVVIALGGVPSIGVGESTIAAFWLWTPLSVLAVVWMTNLFNFMDGSDGLASMQALVSGLLFAAGFHLAGLPVLGGVGLAVAAGAAAFLLWNRPPASIFLGDAGSLTLGFSLGFLALAGTVTGAVSVWTAFIAVSPFVIDATATLALRLGQGSGWYTPHRDHAYQCLIRAGWSHGRVLLALVLLEVCLVVPAFALAVARPKWDLAIATGTGVILLGTWRWARHRAPAEKPDE